MPALPGQNAPASLPSGAARVLCISGQVSVMRKGDWWAVMGDTIITPGQEIVSGPDGHAILQLADQSHVEVFPNSHLIFRNNRGSLTDLIDLLLGKVRIHIEKIGGRPNPYQMNSPTALIAVRGTTFEVMTAEDGMTTVTVEEGAVDVTHRLRPSKDPVRLLPGQSLTVYPNEQISQQKIDHVRTAADILRKVGQDAISIWERAHPGTVATTAGGTTSTTPSSPGGTTTTPVGAGQGTNAPPTNGRGGSGSGSGDSGPGTPTAPSNPGTGTGTTGGTGNTGAPPTTSGPRTVPSAPAVKKNS